MSSAADDFRRAVAQAQKFARELGREGIWLGHSRPTSGTRPAGFNLYEEAQWAAVTGCGLKGERHYRNYFEEMKKDKKNWLDFLELEGNVHQASRTTSILFLLAEALQERGELEEAEDVINMQAEVFPLWERYLADDKADYEYSLYEHRRTSFAIFKQTGRLEKCMEIFRDLVKYEIQTQMPSEQREFVALLPTVSGATEASPVARSNQADVKASMEALDRVTDEQLRKAVEDAKTADQGPESSKAALKACGGCQKVEEYRGDFNVCSRCKKTAYCSRNCQETDWKRHKKEECGSRQ